VKTILVVDDELGSAEVLGLILEDEGYRTYCAVNGQQGLQKAREVRPDLIVLDFMMPIMDGARMGEEVRADPELAHIKLLLNSGLMETAVRERFTGYDAFLRKPYHVEQALDLIKALLER
jgi:CheY-like chemotaxis protein